MLNKIDLPAADPDRYAEEIERVLGLAADEILRISAKTGQGVTELLDAVIARIPAPRATRRAAASPDLRLVLRPVPRGRQRDARRRRAPSTARAASASCQAGTTHELEEIGVRTPVRRRLTSSAPARSATSSPDQDVGEARVGRDRHRRRTPGGEPLAGYRDPKPMVFCGLYPIDGDEFANLRDALEKLQLNDASHHLRARDGHALGFGFRCGFLGLLAHGDRAGAPRARVRPVPDRHRALGRLPRLPHRRPRSTVDNPSSCPPPQQHRPHRGAAAGVTIVTPAEYIGPIMDLCQTAAACSEEMEYLSAERLELVY